MSAPFRLIAAIVVGSAGVVVSLLALRIYHNISFAEPLLLQTSGSEQESLFALWKAIKGLPVYADPLAIPYAHSNFNWLFYVVYGGITRWVLTTFQLADEWLPTVGRLITLTGVFAGAAIAWVTFCAVLLRPRPRWIAWLAGAFALFVFAGPLTGFWAITVRPDIWAAVMETAAICLFIVHWNKTPWRGVIYVLIFGYLAWSFKTISIIGPACVGLFLLVNRRWAMAGALAIGTLLSWIGTLWVGSEIYRFSLIGIVSSVEFDWKVGFRNFWLFASKAIPSLALVFAVLFWDFRTGALRRALNCDETVKFAFLSAGAGFGAAFIGGYQAAAADNYYFQPLFLITLAGLVGLDRAAAGKSMPPAPLLAGLTGGWLAQAAAVIMVLMGFHGAISMRAQHENIVELRPCLRKLPRPAFIDHVTLSLPWVAPGEPYFVLTFYYEWLRAKGFPFEHDGIGGLIRRGYFAALVFQKPRESFDSGPLTGYKRAGYSCGNWVVYLRQEDKL